jgi:GNAT superfamily N-acetyltransferase
MMIKYHPLTPARWTDFESLFGSRGACGGCWCMTWRLPRKQFDEQKGERNRKAMKKIVDGGTSPGILAYEGKTPIGWCAVAPREEYVALGRSRVLKPIDAAPVWSVSCLFVAKEHRRQGVSVGLLKAAVDFVRKQGGEIVEGYPVEPHSETAPPPFIWTGTISAFERAGYKEAARGSSARPIFRCHC